MDSAETTINPLPPFDFDLTAGYHTYFRGRYGGDPLEQGIHQRLVDLGSKVALVSVSSLGSVEFPKLQVRVEGDSLSDDDVTAAAKQVSWLLGCGQDLVGFYGRVEKDPVFGPIRREFHGLHLPHTATVFEALVMAIMGQQIATAVARIVRTAMIETYGVRRTFDGETWYAFPRPESLRDASVEDLRGLKLSQRKAEYIKGIAEAALDPSGWLEGLSRLSDEEAVSRLLELRGVGHWTAQWALVRALGREDAFPAGDLALQRAISNLYFDGRKLSAEDIEGFSQRWSPYRTYATAYIFTALRTGMA